MLRVTLSLRLSCPWLEPSFGDSSKVRILECKPAPLGKGASALVQLRAENLSARTIMRRVSSHPCVVRAEFVEVNPQLLMGVVETSSCPCVGSVLTRTHLLSAHPDGAGNMEWTLLASHARLRELLKRLERDGLKPKILRVERLRGSWGFTSRQQQILEAALKLGFYEVPKRISLSRLAKLFGTSPRAVSEVLRRGERRALAAALSAKWLGYGYSEKTGEEHP